MTDGDVKKERAGIEHAIHGFPPEMKGVTIMSKHGDENGVEKSDPEGTSKGVKIIDPRHGDVG
jgi:hypothetical protein